MNDDDDEAECVFALCVCLASLVFRFRVFSFCGKRVLYHARSLAFQVLMPRLCVLFAAAEAGLHTYKDKNAHVFIIIGITDAYGSYRLSTRGER